MFDPILDPLNEQQRLAVECTDGPVLIIAGAGSGKTRVLTHRMALLLRDGIPPYQILALTFTKKAAGVMRDRIQELVGDQAKRLVMGTFHSVFVRFLREWHSYIGFPHDFTIYDEEDSKSCLKSVIGEVLFGPDWNDKDKIKSMTEDQVKERKRILKIYNTKDIGSRISKLKNDYITPKAYREREDLIAYDASIGHPELAKIYELYMKRCRKAAAMDFDDILVYTNYLLEEVKEAAKALAGRFRYILIDEYQDTNAVQYNIISILQLGHGNITAVGDDSQSIYAFRGAQIRNILNFKNDFSGYKMFKLETNYRSTPQIVTAANNLIENNTARLEKHCVSSRPGGKQIECHHLRNDREEARFIVDYIRQLHNAGLPYESNAILYRINAQSRALEDALMKAHIPYTVYSGTSFFERQEIKDVMAYLRLTVNPDDDEAFKRICNRPARGFGDALLTYLSTEAAMTDLSLNQVSKTNLAMNNSLKPSAIKALRHFMEMMQSLREETKGLDALQATKAIIEKTGIYDYYKKEQDDDGRKRTENINSLIGGIQDFIDIRMEDLPDEGDSIIEQYHISLLDYIEDISLLSNADTDNEPGDKVALMTSHCSKGLEFPTVFIAGVEEGLYPSIRENKCRPSDFEIQEERRLFYVSMTRAKDTLILTNCEKRWNYNEVKDCEPSRFLYEIFPEGD